MPLSHDALRVLQETSRTFFIPIRQLPPGLQEAMAAAYLCMRAIDEIEDHPRLVRGEKARLLHQVSHGLQVHPLEGAFPPEAFLEDALRRQADLPEVTCRLADWARLAPAPGTR